MAAILDARMTRSQRAAISGCIAKISKISQKRFTKFIDCRDGRAQSGAS
jgi:hypothetical protein